MKSERQLKILELISQYPIDTQKALTAYLKEAGYEVTQATVSRDIAQLHLKKVSEHGMVRYVCENTEPAEAGKYISVLRSGYLSCAKAGTIVVIKTAGGMAMAVAAALDGMNFPEIVGTIAGDDTIMCAAADEENAESLINKLNKIL